MTHSPPDVKTAAARLRAEADMMHPVYQSDLAADIRTVLDALDAKERELDKLSEQIVDVLAPSAPVEPPPLQSLFDLADGGAPCGRCGHAHLADGEGCLYTFDRKAGGGQCPCPSYVRAAAASPETEAEPPTHEHKCWLCRTGPHQGGHRCHCGATRPQGQPGEGWSGFAVVSPEPSVTRQEFKRVLANAVRHALNCDSSQDGYSACSCGADAARAAVLRLYDASRRAPSQVSPPLFTQEDALICRNEAQHNDAKEFPRTAARLREVAAKIEATLASRSLSAPPATPEPTEEKP